MPRKFDNNFEDLILRSNYLAKMGNNDHSKDLAKFAHNIKITADTMYNRCIVSFEKAGVSIEDVNQLANLYAHYFFDLYGSKTERGNQIIKDKVLKKYNREVMKEDIDIYDRNGLITFLRQRIQYISGIFSKKAENYLVGKDIVAFYAKTEKSVDIPDDVLVLEPKKYGYRKISHKELKLLKVANNGKRLWKDSYGYVVRKIELFHSHIDPDNYSSIFYGDQDQVMSAEDLIIKKQEKERSDAILFEFESKNVVDKIKYLKAFVSLNSRNDKKTPNVAGAISLIRKLNKQGNNGSISI